jgi:3',5'-cyclic AMP phosphodiesterase CpdA
MKNLIYLIAVSSALLWGCNTQSTDQNSDQEEGFTFAFLTDIHLQPEKKAIEGFKKAIDTINIINPDFVLTGGDLVMDVLNQTYGRSDSLYNLYEEQVKHFNMPVYNTVGNHEVYGWHSEQEGIGDHPEFGKKMYENRLGDRYYSFDHKGLHFMVLDGIYRGESGRYVGRIDSLQMEWIRKDLQQLDKTTPVALSVHIPFITARTQLVDGALAPNSEGLVVANAREVLLEFLDYNLKLVLQGHLHFLEDIFVNNQIHFITAGAVSGRWWSNTPESNPEEGFLLVRVKGEELEWEYVDYGWTPATEN